MKIVRGDFLEAELDSNSVDVVLTSPPYNTNKKATSKNLSTISYSGYPHARYDSFMDNMTEEEYNDFTVKVFRKFESCLRERGVVLYNLNYGSENVEGMFKAINAVMENTNFHLQDVICWKKKSAIPNNVSSCKLTRIFEFVFVFSRSSKFFTNKRIVSVRKNGQKMYENVFNFIEAKNNDGSCDLNKATYSSELCEKLLNYYCPANGVVLDPFMGTGTTGVACKRMKLDFIGYEISEKQVEYAKERIEKCQN